MLTAGAIAPAVEQIASPVTGICSRSENLNLYVNYPLTAWGAYHALPSVFFRNNSWTLADIDMKLDITLRTSILRRLV